MIYIHFPFCKSFCTYCDFYSIVERENVVNYVDALLQEMRLREGFLFRAATESVPTLYFGGGTPSRLPVRELQRIVSAVKDRTGGAAIEEFTVEVNPDDVTADYAKALMDLGVNRISMGVQSFHDAQLKWMNRRHDAAGAKEAFSRLRQAGCRNISIDLIFGYDHRSDGRYRSPGALLLQDWEEDVRTAVSLSPEHISSYQMGIEEGSRLGRLTAQGRYAEPEDEVCAEQYALLQRQLKAAGYEQYEISNFSQPGFRSRHNSAYWDRVPYIGLGPAAHSLDGNVRSWNLPDLSRYISFCLEGKGTCSESEVLGKEEIFEEKIMLGLRKTEGLSVRETGGIDRSCLERLCSSGLVTLEGDRIRIPADRLFISDSIIREFICHYNG